MFMENRTGDLFTHNLWAFWESIPSANRELILQEFKSGAYLWDYNSLFEGFENEGSNEHGDIHILDILLNTTDLELCDLFYKKFLTYKSEEYLRYSFWGAKWEARVSKMKDWAILNNRIEIIKRFEALTPDKIYWKDAHFFISNYSKRVYKLYLDGICDIQRFLDAVMFEIENCGNIHSSVMQIDLTNFSNPVFEQYLIYLEKNKEYQKCIDLINSKCVSKWTNDFSKRLLRCSKKLGKI